MAPEDVPSHPQADSPTDSAGADVTAQPVTEIKTRGSRTTGKFHSKNCCFGPFVLRRRTILRYSTSGKPGPLFLDIHTLPYATEEDVKQAHSADLGIQDQYGVSYLKYWFNEKTGKAFCLVQAPNPEAAAKVQQESHGLVANKILEVDGDLIS